ncbi:restriction endonuclease subunit S [Leuconostoc mesenteroides]|uniref:restriction endonuclease subunit S n=1 Tax=Leuconostoc mesenteroides TaxID=1245 RepID=UPI0006824FF0|nr:restriction endonuclease subunit S [Leuconostoc mesenteroides]MCT3050733.1 restriction endonuclease subunit S [Leuconostoc mesenteroides]TLP93694.1 restriction endonuclease subunit S [Leuconostoc mesenteroides]
MAKIDDSVKKKVPELRFKGFTDDWEERKLSDISNVTKLAGFEFTKYVRYQESGKIIALRGLNVKNGKLVLDEVKYIDDSDFSKLNRSKLYKNDILLTYVGTVGELAIVPENDKYYLAPNVARIRLQDHVNSIFVCQMMNDSNFYNRIISPLIATSSQPALSMENVRKFQLLMPDYQEQEKIGSFFKQLDDTIALHQRKLDLLKEQKKGFLQKMFPKNGSRVPELRFSGFADDWEERKLGEFSDVRDGTHASPKYVSQGHPMVTSKNLTHSGLDMTDVSFLTDEDFNEINKRSKVSIGDILFGMIGTIGNPVIVDRDDFAIKNVALIKEKTSNPITNKWLLQYLKSPSFNRFIQKENAGGTQKFIALGLIRDMKLRVPEFDEQQKIGAFFKKIDETITLHQRKLDLLKEQKKGFLQKMFV